MTGGIRLGRVLGISFTARWSVLALTALLAAGLAQVLLPTEAPGRPAAWYWVAGMGTALGFVGTVALHELAHALAARRRHIDVKSVTLWMLGGHTELGSRPASAGAELAVSSAGPASSLALGGAVLGLAWSARQSGAPALAALSLDWLGSIVLLLGLLNLLPASPLDGGRMLHSAVWKLTGDTSLATRTASLGGQVVGWAMAAAGLLVIAAGYVAGVWLAFTGWMLATASRAEGLQESTRSALEGLTAADLMLPTPVRLPAWLTVQAVVDDKLLGPDRPALPLESWGGDFAGVVGVDRIAAVPERQRGAVRVQDVAWPAAGVPAVGPGTPAWDLLVLLQGRGQWAVVLGQPEDRPAEEPASAGAPARLPAGGVPIGLVSAYELMARASLRRHPAGMGSSGNRPTA